MLNFPILFGKNWVNFSKEMQETIKVLFGALTTSDNNLTPEQKRKKDANRVAILIIPFFAQQTGWKLTPLTKQDFVDAITKKREIDNLKDTFSKAHYLIAEKEDVKMIFELGSPYGTTLETLATQPKTLLTKRQKL